MENQLEEYSELHVIALKGFKDPFVAWLQGKPLVSIIYEFNCLDPYQGNTPLILAIQRWQPTEEEIADFYELDADDTPHPVAEPTERLQLIKLMLEAGADPNKETSDGVKYSDGQTPLSEAAEQDFAEVIPLLVAYGGNLEKYSYGRTPIHCAIKHGSIRALEALIKFGADINATTRVHPNEDTSNEANRTGISIRLSPLQYAINALYPGVGYEPEDDDGQMRLVVRKLLTKGASVHVRNIRGYLSLYDVSLSPLFQKWYDDRCAVAFQMIRFYVDYTLILKLFEREYPALAGLLSAIIFKYAF